MNSFAIGALLRQLFPTIFALLSRPFGGGGEVAKNEMLEELKRQRENYHTLMTNHIAHLDANMAGHTAALERIVEVQAGQLKVLDGLSQDHRQQNQDHQDMREKIARIEGRLDT